MTNEIKEILDRLKKHYILDEKQDIQLLDYITNLQGENNKLKKIVKENVIATCNICEWFGVCPHSYKEYDYKAQIDKAIEYIEEKQKLNKMFGNITLSKDSQEKLLKILRGDE